MIYIIILLFLLLFLSFIISKNNFFSPGVVTSSVWIICLCLFLILEHNLPPLSSQFIWSLIIWVFIFVFSSLSIQSINLKAAKERTPSVLIKDIYWIISLFTYPMLLIFAYRAISLGTTGNWSLDLRLAAIGSSKNFTNIYGGLHILIWQASYLIELLFYNREKRHRIFVLGFFILSFGFLTMSKTIFLNFFLATICILYFKKIISLKHILIGVLFLFFLFIGLQSLRDSVDVSTNKDDFVVLYMLSSMSAFGTIDPSSSVFFGENTFRVFYAIFNRLGFSNIEPVSPILDFVNKPIVTNTYTGMYPYFKDFGYFGIGIFALFLGLFYGYIFKKSQKNDKLFLLIYTYFISYVLFMQYVGDMFFTNIAGHIKLVLLLYLPFFATSRKLFFKKL